MVSRIYMWSFLWRNRWLNLLSSSFLNRTQLTGLGRTLLWRSCTCSVRRAAVWTTGFLRSSSLSVDLGLGSSLAQMLQSFFSGNTHPDEQDDPVSAHPWILLRRIPVQAARRRPEGPPWTVASRPVHAKMTLILYVNEVRYATRATRRPSFFVRMRFGEEGEARSASCGSTEQMSHVEARAVGEEAVLRKRPS